MDYLKLVQWFAGDDTGLSSKHMATVAVGNKGSGHHPLDPGDLGRCIRLVEHVPSIRATFPAIAASSPKWAIVIAHWDELVALFHEEKATKGQWAPQTYARMKALGL